MSNKILPSAGERHPEAYKLMLGFYCDRAYYNSSPECRPAENVLMAIQYALEKCAELARNPGFIEARDTEWDEGVNYAKRFISAAILSSGKVNR